ncbi:MFS transporter [Labrys wisconsinensis]|uniref:MFS family arabinose efflux permease n=1 Tax=Labrys wisconsinensis TaxID=425677 RepID=A0ABU0J5J5_9HYPH|nr:MFS transporter [Labrys wisconsinensis]MDQ0469504.1 putative MFS family arabinose efflux permease [Labrys wisconsinensis]
MHRTLLWLAIGAFAIGSEGLMIAGVLPRIAHDFEIPVAQAGHLVTIFSLAYAVGSPLIAVATASWERRTLLMTAIGVFALANFAAAAAPSFAALAAGRVLLALAAGAFMPTASAYAATAVAPDMRGRALAFVYSGMTIALVIGVPLGTAMAAHLGWRATFAGVGVLSLVVLAGIRLKLPPVAAPPAAGLAERLAVARRPEVLAVIGLTVLVLAGAFGIYTFIGAYLETVYGVPPEMVALALVLAGVAGALGNALGGYAADRWNRRRFLALILGVLVVAFAALSALPELLPGPLGLAGALAVLVVWGLFGWAFPAVQQVRLLAIDPRLASITLSLNASAIYLGSAIGAAVGSTIAEAHTVAAVGWVGAAFEAAALAFLALSARRTAQAAAAAG